MPPGLAKYHVPTRIAAAAAVVIGINAARLPPRASVGGPDGQGPYLNMVVRLDTTLDAHELLELCHRLEEKASRKRIVRWGPRTLDVDVLWVDGETVDEPDLTVPHPRMQDRPFVLAPLGDVAPDLVPNGWERRFDHLGLSRLGELDELTPLDEA